MTRKRNTILAGAALLAAAGLGTGIAVAASGSPAPAPAASASAAAYASPGYSWYQSMMSGYYGTGTGSGSGMMGTGTYLCPVPGHAQKGMTGTFTVR